MHILEGRSLPLLAGERPADWRQYVISEYDYAVTPMAGRLGMASRDARLFMVYDGRYKMMHSAGGHRPMLFDLRVTRTNITTAEMIRRFARLSTGSTAIFMNGGFACRSG